MKKKGKSITHATLGKKKTSHTHPIDEETRYPPPCWVFTLNKSEHQISPQATEIHRVSNTAKNPLRIQHLQLNGITPFLFGSFHCLLRLLMPFPLTCREQVIFHVCCACSFFFFLFLLSLFFGSSFVLCIFNDIVKKKVR